jgi:hypothetical protein
MAKLGQDQHNDTFFFKKGGIYLHMKKILFLIPLFIFGVFLSIPDAKAQQLEPNAIILNWSANYVEIYLMDVDLPDFGENYTTIPLAAGFVKSWVRSVYDGSPINFDTLAKPTYIYVHDFDIDNVLLYVEIMDPPGSTVPPLTDYTGYVVSSIEVIPDSGGDRYIYMTDTSTNYTHKLLESDFQWQHTPTELPAGASFSGTLRVGNLYVLWPGGPTFVLANSYELSYMLGVYDTNKTWADGYDAGYNSAKIEYIEIIARKDLEYETAMAAAEEELRNTIERLEAEKSERYNAGYEAAQTYYYQIGYQEGYAAGSLEGFNGFDWFKAFLINVVGGFLALELVPGVSIGVIVSIPVILWLVPFVIGLFKGEKGT